MRARRSLWILCTTVLIGFLIAAGAEARPHKGKPNRKSAPTAQDMQLGEGTFVGTLRKVTDKGGQIARAELTTDKGMVLLLRLNGKGLELAKNAKGKRVEVKGTAKLYASKEQGRGVELVVLEWKDL